jgi:hypothetical protein
MNGLYAAPTPVTDPAHCIWYHAMDLPGIGSVAGHWDLRATIDDYLGHIDFDGKRCLDLGAASGYLTFEMERRGAREVVPVDLDLAAQECEVVPFADSRFDVAARRARQHENLAAVQRGYWLAHHLLGSQARVHYGSGYHLPTELGMFDVVVVGMMLPHVRDPFRVLEQATARSSETIIVTQQAPQIEGAWAYFMPEPATRQPDAAWWSMSDDCLERLLGILGFRVASKTRAEHACPGRTDGAALVTEWCTTQVAVRVNS